MIPTIPVICRTNLDLFNEEWPTHMPAVPKVGEHIQSKSIKNGFQLILQVKSIHWEYRKHLGYGTNKELWIPIIELHTSNIYHRKINEKGEFVSYSIRDFYEWYAPKVGKSVSYFI